MLFIAFLSAITLLSINLLDLGARFLSHFRNPPERKKDCHLASYRKGPHAYAHEYAYTYTHGHMGTCIYECVGEYGHDESMGIEHLEYMGLHIRAGRIGMRGEYSARVYKLHDKPVQNGTHLQKLHCTMRLDGAGALKRSIQYAKDWIDTYLAATNAAGHEPEISSANPADANSGTRS
jgi:hypothetical protein